MSHTGSINDKSRYSACHNNKFIQKCSFRSNSRNFGKLNFGKALNGIFQFSWHLWSNYLYRKQQQTFDASTSFHKKLLTTVPSDTSGTWPSCMVQTKTRLILFRILKLWFSTLACLCIDLIRWSISCRYISWDDLVLAKSVDKGFRDPAKFMLEAL